MAKHKGVRIGMRCSFSVPVAPEDTARARTHLNSLLTAAWWHPALQRERERGVCVVTSGDFKGRISWSVVCDNSSL